MFKKILLSAVIVLSVVVFVFIWFFNNQNIEVTVVKKSYNLLSKVDDVDKISPLIYINQKKSFISDIKKISKCYLHANESEDSYQMLVNSIDLVDEVVIDDTKFYVYKYELMFKTRFSDNIEIENCSLEIDYMNSKSINLNIGSISCYKYEKLSNSNDIEIKGVKGIVASVDRKKILTGIALRLKLNNKITINSIKCLDVNVKCQDFALFNYDSVDNNMDISTIKGNRYNSLDYKDANFDVDILKFNDDGYVDLVLMLGYKQLYEISSMGLEIDYTVGENLRRLYIEPFMLFINNERTVALSELTFYQYEYN